MRSRSSEQELLEGLTAVHGQLLLLLLLLLFLLLLEIARLIEV